jgi:hypothetical protein
MTRSIPSRQDRSGEYARAKQRRLEAKTRPETILESQRREKNTKAMKTKYAAMSVEDRKRKYQKFKEDLSNNPEKLKLWNAQKENKKLKNTLQSLLVQSETQEHKNWLLNKKVTTLLSKPDLEIMEYLKGPLCKCGEDYVNNMDKEVRLGLFLQLYRVNEMFDAATKKNKK